MNDPSVPRSVHIDFAEEEMAHQINLVGNQSQQGQVTNVNGTCRDRNVRRQNYSTTTTQPACENWQGARKQQHN